MGEAILDFGPQKLQPDFGALSDVLLFVACIYFLLKKDSAENVVIIKITGRLRLVA